MFGSRHYVCQQGRTTPIVQRTAGSCDHLGNVSRVVLRRVTMAKFSKSPLILIPFKAA